MTLIVDSALTVARRALQDGKAVDQAIFENTVNSINHRYHKISEVANHLVDMFPDRGTIMTQCFGETIVGTMLREAKRRGKEIKLFCPETRPFLQGARLTASVAHDQGFDVTVITDNMPAFTMKSKGIDLFTSAADSICLDGHIVNKVGTMQIALAAHHFGVPYFVTGIPDQELTSIDHVTIEERDGEEALSFLGRKHTMDGVKGYYPAFDITPPSLISGVVTDKGIYSPYDVARYYQTEVENYW